MVCAAGNVREFYAYFKHKLGGYSPEFNLQMHFHNKIVKKVNGSALQ